MTHSFVPLLEFEDDDEENLRTIDFEEALTMVQYDALRTWLVGHLSADRWALPTLVAGETGARRGEVLGLQLRDVSTSAMTLSFRRQTIKAKKQPLQLGPLKTRSSRRTISLSLRLTALLDAHLADRPKGRETQLFAAPSGGLCDPDSWTRWSASTARSSLDLPEAATLHTLRHTHASILLGQMQRSDLAVCARLGHSSSIVTRKIYAHWVRMEDDGIGAAFDRLFTDRDIGPDC